MSNPILHYSIETERPIDWARLLEWSSVIAASCWLLNSLILMPLVLSRSFAIWQIGWAVLSAVALYVSVLRMRGAISPRTLSVVLLSLYIVDTLFYLALVISRSGPFNGRRAAPWDLLYLFPTLSRFSYSHWLIVLPLVMRTSNDERPATLNFRTLSICAALLGVVMIAMWTIRIAARTTAREQIQYILLALKSLDGVADLLLPITGLALIVVGSWYAVRMRREAWPMIVVAAMLMLPCTLHVVTLTLNQPAGLQTAGLMSTSILRSLQSSFVAILLAAALVARSYR